jgi:hypothetical protein
MRQAGRMTSDLIAGVRTFVGGSAYGDRTAGVQLPRRVALLKPVVCKSQGNFWNGAHNPRDRSSVERGAGPAAGTVNPSPNATNGAIRATRREAGVTVFDCGAGGVFLYRRYPPTRWPRRYVSNARGSSHLFLRAPIKHRDGRGLHRDDADRTRPGSASAR